jgi:hypothetical protein
VHLVVCTYICIWSVFVLVISISAISLFGTETEYSMFIIKYTQ